MNFIERTSADITALRAARVTMVNVGAKRFGKEPVVLTAVEQKYFDSIDGSYKDIKQGLNAFCAFLDNLCAGIEIAITERNNVLDAMKAERPVTPESFTEADARRGMELVESLRLDLEANLQAARDHHAWEKAFGR